MRTEQLYQTEAYEEGKRAAEYVVGGNNSGANLKNPYEYNTIEWRAWNLGWNETLRAEQP
jgi:hypothetical protein